MPVAYNLIINYEAGWWMVDKAIYIILSIFDAAAMLALMCKLYRLPILMYAKRMSILVLIIAVVSYLLRIRLSLPYFDLPMQYVIFVLFFRYIIKMRFHYAAFIVAAGFITFTNIQLLVYYFYTATGAANSTILAAVSGIAVYIVQISTEAVVFVLCFLLWRFGYGWSFIILPPHNFAKKEKYTGFNMELIVSTIISVAVIVATVVFLHDGNSFPLIILVFICFGVSYYLSKKGEMEP